MKDNIKPLLTIGMIFKNEIRCLKRCLQSLEPLRKSIPSELIMADTGATDGSREIAASYADILFDFPWINDFSAARNAVMDRASGKWYLSIDADEFLDEDISELVDFLKAPGQAEDICALTVRNYDTFEMDEKYSDFSAIRMVRMSTGLRFQGAIHEAWPFEEREHNTVHGLFKTIFHHDGYVGIDREEGREKRERNISLLRQQLDQNPRELKTLLQYVESGKGTSNYLEILRSAIKEVEGRGMGWETFGPPILRQAVKAALQMELPEFWKWTELAGNLFPDSFFTQVDVAYMAFTQSLKDGNSALAIKYGESSLQAIRLSRNNDRTLSESVFGAILMASPYWEQSLQIYLADIYIKQGNIRRGQELLQNTDGTLLDPQQTGNLLCVLGDLHRLSNLDTGPMIQKLYEEIRKPIPSEATAHKREEMFYQTAELAFHSQNRKEEQMEPNFFRPSYMLFIPLLNQCEIGRGAVILASENSTEIKHIFLKVKNWNQLPIEVLCHTIEQGVPFPLSEKPLISEDMNRLANRLAEDEESFYRVIRCILKENLRGNLHKLTWINRIILTAVQRYDWSAKDNNTISGMELAKFFAQAEEIFLSHYYKPEVLCEENIIILPALHRFGWYCAKAFRALETGNATEYIQKLRAGLRTCEVMKPMVEWLTKHTPLLQKKQASPELLALAEQVKTVLASYPPNNPAVEALRASDVYQKVAWLIE